MENNQNPILKMKTVEIIKTLKRLYKNKQIDLFLRQIEILQKNGYSIQALSKNNFPLSQINNEMKAMMNKFLFYHKKLTQNEAGWDKKQLSQNSSISVKLTNSILQLKYDAILHANIQNLCIMIYLTKFYSHYMPFCKQSLQIKQISPLEKVAFLRFKIPFFSDRCAFIHGIGIDRIQQNGTIVICGEGITSNEQKLIKYNIEAKPFMQGTVVMDLKYFICEISPSKEGFLFRSWAEIDTHMSILPKWIINALIKKIGGYIIQKLVQMTKNLAGTIWQKQIKSNYQQNAVFYKWLHKRIQFWNSKPRL